MKEMKRKGLIFALTVELLFVAAIITMSGIPTASINLYTPSNKHTSINLPLKQFAEIRDTVFVLDSSFVIIDLRKQTAYLHQRNDTIKSYKISSGSDKLHKGIKTPTGLFTVQNKTPLAISKQFNNAKLINWIGFKGNVGFHGLATSGYYAHLGKRPSSHGCVRIARNDVEDLYSKVKRGTPVMVIDTTPARVLAFTETTKIDPEIDIILRNNDQLHRSIMALRMDNLLSGKGLDNYRRVILDGNTILKPKGFEIGIASNIPKIHKRSMSMIYSFRSPIDNTNTMLTIYTDLWGNTK
jgi:hypothetical protein